MRRYVKTGAAEVTALLMNVFGYKVLEDAPGEIVKGMAIEDRLDVMVSMPFIVGLSATFICSLYPLAAIPGCLSLCPEGLWQFTKDSAGDGSMHHVCRFHDRFRYDPICPCKSPVVF